MIFDKHNLTQITNLSLVVLLAVTQLLIGCGQPEEVVDTPASVEVQGNHNLELSEEEIAALRARQREMSEAWEAVLEAAMQLEFPVDLSTVKIGDCGAGEKVLELQRN